ncbi:hypothetical protein GALMADRAFT_1141537 [Galerina marginata CBS 339.88]|uniref:Uncharacterized protein n=1 Tax=Galerina marginata (strain CBS 339.88) TaxID=685588 RepID=A0A067SJ80_GALM3|nr:hypothetical protein GALMADRAFT_1141537 [Galerina marginata CBS 339.88]
MIVLTVMISSARTYDVEVSVLQLDRDESSSRSTGDTSIISLTCCPTSLIDFLALCTFTPSPTSVTLLGGNVSTPQRRDPTHPLYRIPEPLLLCSRRLVSRHKNYSRHSGFRTIDASRNGHELCEACRPNVQVPRSTLVFAGVEVSSGVALRMRGTWTTCRCGQV